MTGTSSLLSFSLNIHILVSVKGGNRSTKAHTSTEVSIQLPHTSAREGQNTGFCFIFLCVYVGVHLDTLHRIRNPQGRARRGDGWTEMPSQAPCGNGCLWCSQWVEGPTRAHQAWHQSDITLLVTNIVEQIRPGPGRRHSYCIAVLQPPLQPGSWIPAFFQ